MLRLLPRCSSVAVRLYVKGRDGLGWVLSVPAKAGLWLFSCVLFLLMCLAAGGNCDAEDEGLSHLEGEEKRMGDG